MPFEPRLFDEPDDRAKAGHLKADRFNAEHSADVIANRAIDSALPQTAPVADRWNADSSDSFLPEDMLLLAEQLADDSVRISASYPANHRLPIEEILAAAERQTAAEKLRRQRRLRGVAALAASVAIAAGAWVVRSNSRPADSLLQSEATLGVVDPGSADGDSVAGESSPATSAPASSKESIPSLASRPIRSTSTPTSIEVKDLSGPELEAVLDLIETEERSEDRLSI